MNFPLKLSAMFLLIPFIAVGDPMVTIKETKTISAQPNVYHGWPTVTALKNGQLVLVYSARSYHVCPFGRVEMMTSNDQGETWSWPRVLIDSATDDRDAGILETDKHSLLAFSFTSLGYQDHLNHPEKLLNKTFKDQVGEELQRWKLADAGTTAEEKKADLGMWMLRSTDNGMTWSARLPLPCNSPHGPIQLRDGRLLYAGKELWTTEKMVGVWESLDDGQSWKSLATLPTRPGESLLDYHELHAVEAADGTILVHIRNHNNKKREILQTESKDGGKTWTEPHEIDVKGFPSHLLRLKNNTLLMTYGYRKEPFGIRGKISANNGQTWSEEFRISEDGPKWDLGYPSTAELSDNSLLTVWYEAPKDSIKAALRQAKWKLPPPTESTDSVKTETPSSSLVPHK